MIDALTDQNNALNMEVASLKDALEVCYFDTGCTRMPKERPDQNPPVGQATTLGVHPTSPHSPDEFGMPFHLQLFIQNLIK